MKNIFLRCIAAAALLPAVVATSAMAEPPLLDVGIAAHAFDHLGEIGDQAEAAAASGATIIYPGGFGGLGYGGLPGPDQLNDASRKSAAYLRNAKTHGIRLAIGYVCATSIVKLETFDRNWTEAFRRQFFSPPGDWLQRDREGRPLPSWYGGDYRPACMNHPDWRAYEKFIVRQTLEAGHDGIFFDNPTVHPQGCYCRHCMKNFAAFLAAEGTKLDRPAGGGEAFLRQVAASRPADFLRFRSTIARDFLTEMRRFARSIRPTALVTCNNSLNAPEAFFSQCRTYAYNIYEMSKAEDFLVVEDMCTQPRTLAGGTTIEYGPIYEMLHAISHGKPLVAATIADGDYHTPPNLVRLAIAEAAAHGASYLSWPTWPENVRQQMISAIRPEADLLRQNAVLLNGGERRADAVVFLPFRRWLETGDCRIVKTVRALAAANIPFAVVGEDDLRRRLAVKAPRLLIIESPSVLLESERPLVETYKAYGGRVISTQDENWLTELQGKIRTSLRVLEGPPTVRVIACDQAERTIIHLLNLDVQRISSFQDKVRPASNVRLQVRVPFAKVRSVKAITADSQATRGIIPFRRKADTRGTLLEITIPSLSISTILVVEPVDWEKRRAEILKKMQEAMGPLPDRSHLPALDLKIVGTCQATGYKRYTVSFANVFDERVTAFLYVPDGIRPGERRPGALALQPTGQEGKELVDGGISSRSHRPYASELAQRGYVVVAPDYPSFGQQQNYDFKTSRYASGTMKAISDNLRSIDLLQSREDVDGAKIACIGHSLGGHNTLFTAAFDRRVGVAVSSCGWTPFHYYLGGKSLVNWSQDRYMPLIRDKYGADPDKVPFDFPEVLAAIAPRALFSSSPLRDANFSIEGVRAGALQVEQVYDLLGAKDHFVLRTPDYDHDFADETRREAYQFMDAQLGFQSVRKVP
jgi:pimeloyl-ACP methyl ester carboxylesterase